MSKKPTIKNPSIRDLLEANSVVFETVNGKTSAIYIEEVMRCLESWITERKKHFVGRHRYCDDVKQSMDHLLKELKCDVCPTRHDCSVVYDPKDCVLEVSSNNDNKTEGETNDKKS